MSTDRIRIRTATSEDLDTLSELIAASYATLRESGYETQALEAAMPKMSRANPDLLSSGTYFVAEVDGVPAGCGGWTTAKPGTGEIVDGVAHIRHFATHPRFVRMGIARLLLDRCLAEAHATGARLMKSQSTLSGERFYAAAGFRRIGEVEVEFAPGIILPAIEMERALP
ncbi:GNAT family N-acetyltransferase [Aquamicrobium sp. LC103]|uniref:GNAT family N-acetyltransferase n=1 Tax=Aquamicrobium sp. LC103 TaxID=1120658 RepID=UPI00063EA288|nr:GNAT family N-acetyltransferase [Aquamicrobium sp. LC103]